MPSTCTKNYNTSKSQIKDAESYAGKFFYAFSNSTSESKNGLLTNGKDSKIYSPIGEYNEPLASDTYSQKAEPLDGQRVELRKTSTKKAKNSNQNYEHQSKQQIGVKSDIPPP